MDSEDKIRVKLIEALIDLERKNNYSIDGYHVKDMKEISPELRQYDDSKLRGFLRGMFLVMYLPNGKGEGVFRLCMYRGM